MIRYCICNAHDGWHAILSFFFNERAAALLLSLLLWWLVYWLYAVCLFSCIFVSIFYKSAWLLKKYTGVGMMTINWLLPCSPSQKVRTDAMTYKKYKKSSFAAVECVYIFEWQHGKLIKSISICYSVYINLFHRHTTSIQFYNPSGVGQLIYYKLYNSHTLLSQPL